MLENEKIINPELASKLVSMVGFRNMIVHQYFRIDMERVARLVEEDLGDLEVFASEILKKTGI